MGRYYNGDIEGKFWVGVQSSSDPEFFGATEDTSHIQYYVEDLEQIGKGVKECEKKLGKYKLEIDKFFEKHNGYNDEMIEKELKLDTMQVKNMLEWYARLTLGLKMQKCVQEQGYCSFEAEL